MGVKDGARKLASYGIALHTGGAAGFIRYNESHDVIKTAAETIAIDTKERDVDQVASGIIRIIDCSQEGVACLINQYMPIAIGFSFGRSFNS
jgi:hypothetical protein